METADDEEDGMRTSVLTNDASGKKFKTLLEKLHLINDDRYASIDNQSWLLTEAED